jgi:hypothetical protein
MPQAPEGARDAHGRFGQGNRGGPGNPFARQVAALHAGLLARLTPEDLGDIAEALVREAKGGNVAAAKLLLSYTLGKPAQAADVADDRLCQFAEAVHARTAEEEQEAAAHRPAPQAETPAARPKPAVDEAALARVGKLLGLTPPSANGLDGLLAGVKPPSANGGGAAREGRRPSANGSHRPDGPAPTA